MGCVLIVALALAGALDTNKPFQEGVGLYQELEFEQAIFRFEEAALAPDLTEQEKALVFSWMAMSYAGIGKAEGAKRSLRNALSKDRDLVLPSFAPPKVKEWMNEVKAKMGPETAKPADSSSAGDGDGDVKSDGDGDGDGDGDAAGDDDAERADGDGGEVGNDDNDATEEVEEIVLEPEQPDESGGGGAIIGGILMMGGGVGSVLITAVAAVPATIAWVDALLVIPGYLQSLDPNSEDYRLYQEAQQVDYAFGVGLTAVAAVFAALGIGLVVIGAGTAIYGALE